MNNILLTADARQKAKENWYEAEAEHIEDMTEAELRIAEDEAICRAQVRKVVEWLLTNSYWEDPIHLIVSRESMAALKAAGGEG